VWRDATIGPSLAACLRAACVLRCRRCVHNRVSACLCRCACAAAACHVSTCVRRAGHDRAACVCCYACQVPSLVAPISVCRRTVCTSVFLCCCCGTMACPHRTHTLLIVCWTLNYLRVVACCVSVPHSLCAVARGSASLAIGRASTRSAADVSRVAYCVTHACSVRLLLIDADAWMSCAAFDVAGC